MKTIYLTDREYEFIEKLLDITGDLVNQNHLVRNAIASVATPLPDIKEHLGTNLTHLMIEFGEPSAPEEVLKREKEQIRRFNQHAVNTARKALRV